MKLSLNLFNSEQMSWPKFLSLSTICMATVFALLNPSATKDLSIVPRALFWLAQVSALLAMMQMTQLGLQRLNPFYKWPIVAQLILSGFLGAALFVPIGMWLDGILGLDGETVFLSQKWYLAFWQELGFVSPPALTTWLGLNAIRLRGALGTIPDQTPAASDHIGSQDIRAPENQAERQHNKNEPLKPAFVALLPTHLGTDLVALSAELHYTRVHTYAGQALIFYPFGRAIEELKEAGYPGVQVHRSHWVAQTHILQKKRLNSRGLLQTDTGLTLPVSRRRKNELSQIL